MAVLGTRRNPSGRANRCGRIPPARPGARRAMGRPFTRSTARVRSSFRARSPSASRLPHMTVDADFAELKQRLKTIEHLRGAERALIWDQATYMPPSAAEARGRQLALLSSLAHERLADAAIGRLLDSVTPRAEAQGADSDDGALVRVTRREHERA